MEQLLNNDAMTKGGQSAMRRNVALEGEHPDVVVGDVHFRARPDALTIVVANEKGGVGKSTLAFHLAMALCAEGRSVAAVDLDVRQQTFARALQRRQGLAARQKRAMPMPKFNVAQMPSGAVLCQDLCRVGAAADIIIIDAPGCDSPIIRRAIAIADVLATPIGASLVDLDLLGRVASEPGAAPQLGRFATTVAEIREARAARGLPGPEWMVLPMRTGANPKRAHRPFTLALEALSHVAGFTIGQGLTERNAYRDLLPQGLTPLDIALAPQAVRPDAAAQREIRALAAQLTAGACIPEPALKMRVAAPAGAPAAGLE